MTFVLESLGWLQGDYDGFETVYEQCMRCCQEFYRQVSSSWTPTPLLASAWDELLDYTPLCVMCVNEALK